MRINPSKHLGWTEKLFTHSVPGNGKSTGDGNLEAISGFVDGWPPGSRASDWLKHFRRYLLTTRWPTDGKEQQKRKDAQSHQATKDIERGKNGHTDTHTHTNIWRSQAKDLLIVRNQSCVTSRTKGAQTGKKKKNPLCLNQRRWIIVYDCLIKDRKSGVMPAIRCPLHPETFLVPVCFVTCQPVVF